MLGDRSRRKVSGGWSFWLIFMRTRAEHVLDGADKRRADLRATLFSSAFFCSTSLPMSTFLPKLRQRSLDR